ncbi:MAG: GTP-binding protein [Rhodospirillaceae bacterium]|nr:GTP-binding protein [Rhodospirillaceae bacterium]
MMGKPSQTMPPIEITVLSGFLGSGKTTLIKNLLELPGLEKTAVIINEFGEIGLDHELIETSEEDLVELSTGCICCVMRGDLQEAIERLVVRQKEGKFFERIILETTGLADPGPILHSLIYNDYLKSLVTLGRVIITVDAINGLNSIKNYDECQRQIALADILLITKSDISSTYVEDLRAELSRINPTASAFLSNSGKTENDLFSIAINQKDRIEEIIFNDRDYHHTHGDLHSIGIRRKHPIKAITLTLFLETLAQVLGENLVRLKGIIYIEEAAHTPAVIHGVQHVFHPMSWLAGWSGKNPETRLVLIGRRLSVDWVEAVLDTIEEEVSRAM